jgi:hypothetical protein
MNKGVKIWNRVRFTNHEYDVRVQGNTIDFGLYSAILS